MAITANFEKGQRDYVQRLNQLVTEHNEDMQGVHAVKVDITAALTAVSDARAAATGAEAARAAAQTASGNADAKAGAAAASATAAAQSAASIVDSVAVAMGAAGDAEAAATAALAAAAGIVADAQTLKAWAVKTDGPVDGGEYSAKYWALQAAQSIHGSVVFRGIWSPASGEFPPSPAAGDWWAVSGSAEVDGVLYRAGSTIIYDGTRWTAVGNDPVTPTLAELGLGNVDNTRDAEKPVSTATAAALAEKADKTHAHPERQQTLTGAAIDLSSGEVFVKAITADTTFSISNAAAAGKVSSFLLDLTNAGSKTLTWWAGIKWPGGSAPALTAAGRDVLGFFSYDGGTTWTGLLLGADIK